jgi:luciferase family oxidoreductase group 1
MSALLSKIPFSVLDLAPLREGGTTADAFRDTLDLARHVERWGYRRFWLAEHHNIYGIACSATSVLIGYVAGGTSTIRVGSGGVMLPNHAPLVIAEQFGTLEALHPGRIDLGLGRAPGGDYAAARALRSDLRDGDDFAALLEELRAYFAPPQPAQAVHAYPGEGVNIPIWLLGSSGYSAELAGLLGLPFAFAAHFQPDNLEGALGLYRDSFRPSPHLSQPHAMACIPVIVAGTDEQAQLLATTAQRKFLNLIRNRPTHLMPPAPVLDWSPAEQAAVTSKLRAAVVGSPATVERHLDTFLARTQLQELMVVTDTYHHADRLRSYELLASLRSSG